MLGGYVVQLFCQSSYGSCWTNVACNARSTRDLKAVVPSTAASTSLACRASVCRYFLAPQKRREGETVDQFASRVQDMIAKQVRANMLYSCRHTFHLAADMGSARHPI